MSPAFQDAASCCLPHLEPDTTCLPQVAPTAPHSCLCQQKGCVKVPSCCSVPPERQAADDPLLHSSAPATSTHALPMPTPGGQVALRSSPPASLPSHYQRSLLWVACGVATLRLTLPITHLQFSSHGAGRKGYQAAYLSGYFHGMCPLRSPLARTTITGPHCKALQHKGKTLSFRLRWFCFF